MAYRLPSDESDNLRIAVNARYAESFSDALRTTRRYIEITEGNRSSFGVMAIGSERYFGRMPLPGALDGPSIENPKTIDELGDNLQLAEQKSVLAEFKKVQNGRIRDAMTAISQQLGDRPVYFQYYGHGLIAVLQKEGMWAPCLLRFQDATTIAEERVCAKVNKASRDTYSVLTNALAEMVRRHEEEEAERLRRVETDSSGEDADDNESENQSEVPEDEGRWADDSNYVPPDPAYDIEWDDIDNVSF